MNIKEQLQAWFDRVASAEQLLDTISPILGVDNAIQEELGTTLDALTGAVSQIVGDVNKHIEWFWLENDLGKKGLEAGPTGNLRPIKTLDDLIWLLEVSS